jgi:hypothetical protein
MADRAWWLLEVLALMRERRSFVPYSREVGRAGAVKPLLPTPLSFLPYLVHLPTDLLT